MGQRVVLDAMNRLDRNGDGELDWAEMADARERALHDQEYGLYYSLDHVMRKGADVFLDRGEGMDLRLRKPDLALLAGRDRVDLADVKWLLPISAAHRATEAACLSQFIEAHPQEGDRLELEDLYRLAAGYWRDAQGQEATVPDPVRQAALYFTQNPTELAALSSQEVTDAGTHRWVAKADLKSAGEGAAVPTEVITPTEAAGQKPLQIGVREAGLDQQSDHWVILLQRFDDLDRSENPSLPGDGKVSLRDLKVALQQALQAGDWPTYDALGWMLQHFEHYADEPGLLSREVAWTAAARSVLESHFNEVDVADGQAHGLYGLPGLQALQARLEKSQETFKAQWIAWLIQCYQARIDRLAQSLDVDEGMRLDGRPADDLISIEGDIRQQAEAGTLSDADRAALYALLDNLHLIPHYGDLADIVSKPDVQQLLAANLQWFDGAADVARRREQQQALDQANLQSGMGLDL